MKVPVAVFIAFMFVAGACAQTNTVAQAWSAPVTMTQTVSSVKLNNIQIVVLPNGTIGVITAWSWLSSSGEVLRNGVTRYTEAEVSAKLAARGSSLDQFKTLFLSIALEECGK